MHRKISNLILGAISVVAISVAVSISTHAQDLNYSVSVEPALNITTSSGEVSLDLNPLTHSFDSQTLTVSVSTNNPFGYKLYVATNEDKTDLTENSDPSLTIQTLDPKDGGYSESAFTANRWGYKLNSANTNFIPFSSNTIVNYSSKAIDNNSTTMTFAAKVDYDTKAGSYSLPLNFQAVGSVAIAYIQDFTKAMCQEKASTSSVVVQDIRDGNEYNVRYINGNCWMVQNLRFTGTELSSSTSNVATNYTDTNPYKINNGNGWVDLTEGNSYDEARLHIATSDQVPSGATYTANDMGVWYNYAGASAGTITGSSNTSTQVYDVCPKGWRLPTNSEQPSVIDYLLTFSPVAGGTYWAGLPIVTENGYWWSANPSSATSRYVLYWYYGTVLSMGGDVRQYGFYIRCLRST